MPTKGGNKPRNTYPAQQVLSTLRTNPCGCSFPQGSHHSSSVSDHSTITPNKYRALRRAASAVLEGQGNMGITRSFAKDNPEFSRVRGQNDTFHQKVSETAPVKLSRCNSFCSNQTLLVISFPNQNNTGKNNLLTDDTFFLKTVFLMLFLSHFHCIEIAPDIRKQLCCTHPTTAPQLHESLPASL